MHKVNVFMDAERQILSLLDSICEGLNSFFSSETQRKMCPMVRKKPHLSPLLKNGHLQMTLELKARIGNFSALCNIAPKCDTMISCERQDLDTLKALP